jgi:hypothetical protein
MADMNLSRLPRRMEITISRHLLERAGFGGTPEEIKRSPEWRCGMRRQLVYFQKIQNSLPAFDHSGIHDPASNLSRKPARSNKAGEEKGEALGIKGASTGG